MVKETFWGKFDAKSLENIHEPWLFSIPAVILGLLIPIIFFIPNLFTQHIVIPALRSVSQLQKFEAIAPRFTMAWHKFTANFTIVIIAVYLEHCLLIGNISV